MDEEDSVLVRRFVYDSEALSTAPILAKYGSDEYADLNYCASLIAEFKDLETSYDNHAPGDVYMSVETNVGQEE